MFVWSGFKLKRKVNLITSKSLPPTLKSLLQGGTKNLYLYPSTHTAKETSLSRCVRLTCVFVVPLAVTNRKKINLVTQVFRIILPHQVIFTFTLLHFSSTSPKKPNWCSRKTCIGTQLLLHIPPICLREKLCIIDKENKRGWPYSSLQRTK